VAGDRVSRATRLPVAPPGDGVGGASHISATSFNDLPALNGTYYF
jgi:hypothetical protein